MLMQHSTLMMIASITLADGFLAAIAGSGGLLLLPALLLTGMPVHLALGTNKCYTMASLSTSTLSFLRKGFLNPRYWIAAAIATFWGSLFGVILTQLINPDVIAKALPIALGLTLIYQIVSPFISKVAQKRREEKPHKLGSIALGWVLGIYSGFIGVGTGTFWTTLSASLFKLELMEASALARFMGFVSNLCALGMFVYLKQVDYTIGLMLAVLGVIGAFFGSKVAARFGAKLVRPLIILCTGGMTVKLLLSSWG